MIFSIKDSLRQAIEAASGGLCTVMYTRKGQPTFLRRIPRFDLQDLDPSLGTGPHPAFVVGERTVSEIWVGMYPGVLSQGELISVPGAAPTLMTFADAVAAARANGPGFHLLTNAELAAVLLMHWAMNNKQDVLRGNTYWGRSHEAPWETAVRVDGRAPGETTGEHVHLTGSGPLTWRHDGTAWGIADLVSPKGWVAGLRLVNGEIQIIPNNNAAVNVDTDWRAILPDGSLVPPGTSGTLKWDIPLNASYSNDNVVQNLGAPILRTTRQSPPAEWDSAVPYGDYARGDWSSVTAESGVSVPAIVRALLILPPNGFKGHLIVRPYGTRLATRGLWGSEVGSGGATLDLDRTNTVLRIPRIAFVL